MTPSAWPGYLGERGSYAAALELRQRVLNARERVLGPEHPGTLTTRHNLARWTGDAGDAAAACDQYAELLPIRERSSAPTTPAPWPPDMSSIRSGARGSS